MTPLNSGVGFRSILAFLFHHVSLFCFSSVFILFLPFLFIVDSATIFLFWIGLMFSQCMERVHSFLYPCPMNDSMQLFHAFAGNSQNYRPRCCGQPDSLSPEDARPRAIVDRVVHSTEGDIIVCCLFYYPTNVRESLLQARKLSLYV